MKDGHFEESVQSKYFNHFLVASSLGESKKRVSQATREQDMDEKVSDPN